MDSIVLNNGYVLWYHSITEKSWDMDTYINLCEDLENKKISSFEELIDIYNILNNNFNAGMFFLMKDGILPKWEDPNNINGGYWSFKVSKKKSNLIWKKLSLGLIGNSLTDNKKYMENITGISVSPKISNCVMKIWNSTNKQSKCNIFTDEIDGINDNAIRYNKNK